MGLRRKYLQMLNRIDQQTDTEVASILTDTGTTLDAALAVVDANVDAILVDTGTTLNDKIDVVDGIADNLILYAAPVTVTGEADIDISEADYTGFVTLLTITPDTSKPLADLVIDLDYNKATTGVDTVATASDTLDVYVYTKVDGTNARVALKGSQKTLTGAGTLVDSGERFNVGAVSVAQTVIVKVKLNAERGDAEIPYSITYRALGAPTVTPVAAA